MAMRHWTLLLGALAAGGCSGGDRAARAPDSTGMMGHMDSSGMGMGGMPRQGMQMMPQMRAHLDSMSRLSPQQVQGMMAAHEAMMSRMMDAMGADMRGMSMSASPEWSTLTDSVKEDLAELPGLKGEELAKHMQAHADRVKRLMARHEKMMEK